MGGHLNRVAAWKHNAHEARPKRNGIGRRVPRVQWLEVARHLSVVHGEFQPIPVIGPPTRCELEPSQATRAAAPVPLTTHPPGDTVHIATASVRRNVQALAAPSPGGHATPRLHAHRPEEIAVTPSPLPLTQPTIRTHAFPSRRSVAGALIVGRPVVAGADFRDWPSSTPSGP